MQPPQPPPQPQPPRPQGWAGPPQPQPGWAGPPQPQNPAAAIPAPEIPEPRSGVVAALGALLAGLVGALVFAGGAEFIEQVIFEGEYASGIEAFSRLLGTLVAFLGLFGLGEVVYASALALAAGIVLPPGQRSWAVLVAALFPPTIAGALFAVFLTLAQNPESSLGSGIDLSMPVVLALTALPGCVVFWIAARQPARLRARAGAAHAPGGSPQRPQGQ